MKSTTIALALALAAATASAEPVEGHDGSTWTPLPVTFRAYKNTNGVQQYDMLFQVELVPDKDTPKGLTRRSRYAVVGCSQGFGQIGKINYGGDTTGTFLEWVAGGTQVLDMLAMEVCGAALERGHLQAAPVGRRL